ncbi:MAG: flagellar biosynthetic protein FliR [Leptospirales bacterium]
MDLFADKFQIFVLLFARILALLSIMPAFGGQGVPAFHRVSLSLLISFMATPVVEFPEGFETLIETRFLGLVLEQAFMGILIGFSLQLLFAAFQMAGEFFSVQMGFGISEVFDPLAQVSLPLMGTLKNLIALYVFFVSGAHLMTFQAMVQSFANHPYFSTEFLSNGAVHIGILDYLALSGSSMFLVGIKIAFPVMGTLLLVSITMGILSKAAPQMNILMLGFPLKIMVAFLVLTWVSPIMVELIQSQFDSYFNHLHELLNSWNTH